MQQLSLLEAPPPQNAPPVWNTLDEEHRASLVKRLARLIAKTIAPHPESTPMSELSKITSDHLRRRAVVYVRQSSTTQVEHNRESTARQYQLAERAVTLGWARDQVTTIDEDLGVSGSGLAERPGFARMIADVALGQIGIVLGLEVSRLARNNADWYRLLDLCGVTHTLIGDADGIYHPGLFNDRQVLGLKGTMSEAELHVLLARLLGGIRNKAARGELHRGLPVGLVRGDADGEVLLHPDESVRAAIRAVFERFAEMGSARRVWLWLRSQGLRFPLQSNTLPDVRWVAPTYTKVHEVLTNPFYAGVYVYGRTQQTCYLDEGGRLRKRIRQRPRAEWPVFIRDHHEGFIDWPTFEANQKRLAQNTRPRPHHSGGAVREGAALLQGIAVCGHCGRRLAVHCSGRHSAPGYHCAGKNIVNGRGEYCLNVGGVQIDTAVAGAFLAALAPAGLSASLEAIEQLEAGHETTLAQFRRDVERAQYGAQRAERRYRAVDPQNRLVARGLEVEWERALQELKAAEAELAQREHSRPRPLTREERDSILSLGKDLARVWSEREEHANPLGVKGIGEVGIVGVAAAIANAVYNATGARFREAPVTLDRVNGFAELLIGGLRSYRVSHFLRRGLNFAARRTLFSTSSILFPVNAWRRGFFAHAAKLAGRMRHH